MQTSPDGWIPGYCTVQAKTAQGWDEAKWDVAVPDVYVIQVHHEMIVLDVRKAYIPVTFGIKDPGCLRWRGTRVSLTADPGRACVLEAGLRARPSGY